MNTCPQVEAAARGAVPRGRIPPALVIGAGAVLLAVGAGAAGLALQRGEAAPQGPIALADSLAPPENVAPPAAPSAKTEATAAVSHRALPRAAGASPQAVARATPVCATCGVVESVQAVKHKGEGTGLGAVAGGVVGGVVGNQIGSGNGRKAMTVIGAVGGGVAGHEIEKHARATTVYSVKVRMDDGSLRTLTQPQPPAVGARVRVEGASLRAAG